MRSRRLTKRDCADLRRQLQDLGYGQAEGESSNLFARRLYPVTEHLRALDPGTVLITGPRGAGKSELFNAFFQEDEAVGKAVLRRAPATVRKGVRFESAAWKSAYPAGTGFPDSGALLKMVDSEERAKNVWHAMLVRLLAEEFDAREREELAPLLRPMAANLSEILEAMEGLKVNPTAALDALEHRLRERDRWIFVGYDELDTLGGFDWRLATTLVRGLVAFWSDYSRRWRRIRAKIFLRSDLFRRHAGMGTADFAKLAANRAELVWSDTAILGMLVKRIANTSEGLASYCRGTKISLDDDDDVLGLLPRMEGASDAHPLLERMAGEYMGAGRKKGYVHNWVLDHPRDGNRQVSPRTLVRLIEQAARKDAPNQTLRPPRLIHTTALRQALDDVSGDHVRQATTSEWPWLHGVQRRVERQRLVPWTYDEIVRLLEADWDEDWSATDPGSADPGIRPPENAPMHFVEYLIELGVFRRRPDDRVDVPDLYLFGLNLRRKGGVRRGSGGRAGRS